MSMVEGLDPHNDPFATWEAQFAQEAPELDGIELSPELLLEETNLQIQSLIDLATSGDVNEVNGVTVSTETDEYGATKATFHRLSVLGEPEAYQLARSRYGDYTVSHTHDIPVDPTVDFYERETLVRSTEPFGDVSIFKTVGFKTDGAFKGSSTTFKHIYAPMQAGGIKELQGELTELQQQCAGGAVPSPIETLPSASTEASPAPKTTTAEGSPEKLKQRRKGSFLDRLGRLVLGSDDILQ